MTIRRQILLAGALGALGMLGASRVRAQPRPVRIGVLSARPLAESVYAAPLVRRLAELGYRDGGGAILEYRSTDGFIDRYADQARELINLECDIIFTIGAEEPVRALMQLRSLVPTVFFAGDYDPLERGIVTSLSRPGGNMTGVYAPQGVLVAKRVQLLREVLPRARQFLAFADGFSRNHLGAARKAAAATGVQLTIVEFSKPPYDFAEAFETGRQAGTEGLLVLNSPVFASNAADLFALAAKHRLPSVGGGYRGVLLAYYGDVDKIARRAAEMGARILKGAKPADIPVEQIDEFQLVINSKLARMLGLKIPESVMARATRILQ
jgi:putative ABC transport system substrate-binding protein